MKIAAVLCILSVCYIASTEQAAVPAAWPWCAHIPQQVMEGDETQDPAIARDGGI